MPTLPSTKKAASQGVNQGQPTESRVVPNHSRKKLLGILPSIQAKPEERGILDVILADEPKIEDMMIPSRSEYSTTDRDIDL